MNNALPAVCGLVCIYPLIVGFVGFFVGRYWGRIKLRSPIGIERQIPSQSGRNPYGPGKPGR